MALPTEIIRYGDASLKLSETVSLRYDGLDEVTQRWVTTNANLYSTGGTMPSYGNVKIDSISREQSAGDYILTLTGTGLTEAKGTRVEKGYPKITRNLEGLDEATHSVISNSSTNIDRGDTLPGNANMYCVSATAEEIYSGYYRIQGRYMGMIGTKTYKRTITVNGQQIDLESVQMAGLPGGWSGYRKGQISLPKIVVSDFQVLNGSPPTDTIPGNATPPSPPSIKSLTFTGPTRSIWPNGWVLSSIDGSYIAGTTIWAGTLAYEYVWATIPADA